MRLFSALYCDEDVDVRIATMLRAWGFDALTTVLAQNLGKSDREQLAYACATGKVLVTHNRVDFERLATEWFATERAHADIVIAVRRPPRELAERLRQFLDRITADEMRDQLLYL